MVVKVNFHTLLEEQFSFTATKTLSVEIPPSSKVKDLISLLHITYPVESLIITVNHRVVDEEVRINDGDIIDLIPAMSGG